MAERDRAQQLTREGIAAIRTDDHKTALQRFSQAVKLDPAFAEAWYYLGRTLDDPARQIECLERAVQLDPTLDRARKALDQLRARYGLPEDDELELDTLFDDNPGDPFDTPFAAPPPPRQPSQAQVVADRVRQQMGAEMGRIGQSVMSEFTPENRQQLFGAWQAALTFDSARSYEAYRGRTNPTSTAAIMAILFAVSPLVLIIVALVVFGGLDNAEFGDVMELLFRGFLGSLLLSAQMVMALYIASAVSARVARQQYKSKVSTNEHFGLSGLYFIPMTLLFIVGGSILIILSRLFIDDPGSIWQVPISATLFAALVYANIQFAFSNAAIHRLNAVPALIITFASSLVAGVAFAWLVPVTFPLLQDIFTL